MKTASQNAPELEKLSELIKDMSVGMLTTMNSHSALVSRPISALEMDGSGDLWFFTDKNSEKIESLNTMNLSFTNEGNGTYISLSGCGELHFDDERIKNLWTSFAKPWFPEGPDSPNLALLKFSPYTAEYWDAPHSKMVRMFAMAASITAGRPIGLGDHDTLTELSKSPAQTTLL
jgi:general stress protein 26